MADRRRKKVLQDKIFHELWLIAKEYKDPYRYANEIIRESRINRMLEKAGLDTDEIYDMAKQIYIMYQMPVSEIVKKSGKKKAEISHMFCIPIRTLEDWTAAKAKCPDYTRLMMLKQFHLFRLGKYIYLASEEEWKRNVPPVYEHSEDYEITRMYRQSSEETTAAKKKHRTTAEYTQTHLEGGFDKDTGKNTYHNSRSQLEDDMRYIDNLIRQRREKKEQEKLGML